MKTLDRADIALVLNRLPIGTTVEDIHSWVILCLNFATKMELSAQQKDEFLTACGFDLAIGHYDWRGEFC
jgi:hypothetical protein